MKKITAFVLALIMLFALVGCGSSSESPDPGPGSEDPGNLTTVTVSEFRGIDWASTYVADLLGYFEEEGLNVEYAVYKDGPIAFQGMHAGDSDFSLLSAEPVMRGYDEGMASYFILTNADNRVYGFATQPDITSVEQLKGKTIFAGGPGSAPHSFVLSLLASAGLSENDVSIMNMEYGASIGSFGRGQLDGIFFDIYEKHTLLAAVPEANILIDATDPATHKELYGSEYCQTAIVTCTKEFADNNPETVQAFTNASVRALKWIDEHSAQELAELLAPLFEGISTDELTLKLEALKSSFSKTGEINPEGYATVEKFCYEQGLISERIPYEDIVQTQFVKNALAQQ